MQTPMLSSHAQNAILTLAEIKAAIEAFERGATNVFDALDTIVVVTEAYEAVAESRRDAA
ncbi:MAG: hypothetical protein ACKOSQ_05585 [Planctomycetaceae bacterium]